ncbi:isoleucine--tRNA ligase [Marinitenerispora sediminis]|uniref:Isoleucine--tRNA ligase n=1 Tax=Marinitenerispora sediminis TaxID=1931232 RepID=A0A368T549_9ACTN|nr:isoleucine--tRNA ligase [Marinitenerispora sediminis]RCV54503.1 isoleucine--tRNA ligase [Marinitenerispora sediminis]RCV58729.1 isoleucine--tRNA ligase [Marinitenerispora sediminis]RCV61367.1 isoleucine--tRNA ligase [Marinitenerispora sediminis]
MSQEQRPASPPFPALPAQVDLPAVEHEVLRRWSDQKVFERSLEQTRGGRNWVFFEGPPTANGQPGVHHVEARVFKDVFPRFKTMKGFHVDRKAGWDCHGLPVEVAVEKELGLSGKKDIETFGVAEFNDRCRESVLRNVDAFTAMTERMGYWVNMDEAYRTMDPEYVESVWWSLKVIWEKGLLFRDYRISPYCPRCGTTLADHELAQGYETVTDPSVYVRFPVTSGPLADPGRPTSLLVWTTTPWTLVSNTAVAVHPEVQYVVATNGTERLLVAEPLLGSALGEGWQPTGERFEGAEMERWTYQRPFELVAFEEPAHYVVLADYVTVEDGTGLVHQSPAFGADDMAVCRSYGLPVVNPVRADGTFEAGLDLVGGVFFKTADATLVTDLKERGLLFRHVAYEHSYPHCWRCHTPLMYYALPSWYIRTTAIKDRLLEQNAATNWVPGNIKEGRYGEWLRNNVDWALSRSRYWGTPLPVWTCVEDHVTVVGSLAELGGLAGRDLSALDPHRPYVDDVVFDCPECGGTARRVPEVIDVWYDSGSMPFAQWGAPHRNDEVFRANFPGQYICEAIDQTRGWFYSMMTVSTLVFGQTSYKNVVCLGHILAEDGRKMSKHLGNVLEPMAVMERHGADAVRWFMAASGSPWTPRRVGHAALEEIVRKVLLTYYNTASFFTLYANAGETWSHARLADAPAPAERPLLDRWVLSELNRVVRGVDEALERFDTAAAGRLLTAFVDDLSNWYVRRSRRRFWSGASTPEGAAAFATLFECLETVTLLMAPLVPFLTDHVWVALRRPDAPESVHLARWPQVREELIDTGLSEQMALTRRLVELGRAARADSGVRTRQPLARALVGAAGFGDLPEQLRGQVADELNVVRLDPLSSVGGDLVDYVVKPNFRTLGKRFAKRTPLVAKAIQAADARKLVEQVRSTGWAHVEVAGEPVEVSAEEVLVTEQPREGWAVAAESGETVALDLEITPELQRAGLAREVVRLVQDARKSSGLDISDRIDLWWAATDPVTAQAVAEHGAVIGAEVLARDLAEGAPDGPAHAVEAPDFGLRFWLRKV